MKAREHASGKIIITRKPKANVKGVFAAEREQQLASLTRGAEQQSAEVISHPSANLVSHAGANDKFRAACHALAVAGMLTGPIPINRKVRTLFRRRSESTPRQRPSLAALTHRIALFKASPLSVFAVKTRGSHHHFAPRPIILPLVSCPLLPDSFQRRRLPAPVPQEPAESNGGGR